MDGDGSDEVEDSPLSEELSSLSGTPVAGYPKDYRPCRLYGTSSCRTAPDGGERYSRSPPDNLYLDKEGSLVSESEAPSACSMSGSMLDLVQNAREVRRLIREASFDSTTSDLSLDLNSYDNLGAGTVEDFDTLCRGLNKLIDNCDNLNEDISLLPVAEAKMVSSKSSMSGLSQYASSETGGGGGGGAASDTAEEIGSGELKREGSIPDLRTLQRSLRQNKGVWKLTNFSNLSDSTDRFGSRQASIVSDTGSFEWDSPVHGWHDFKSSASTSRVPLASYSSNVSESGDEVASFAGSGLDPWEWDDQCYILQGDEELAPMGGHGSWLPEMSAELDLETELRLRELSSGRTSCTTSSRSSLDRDLLFVYPPPRATRLPPSGRSSMDRESRLSVSSSASSDDLTITATANHRRRRSDEVVEAGAATALMEASRTSLDTGIASMDSSVSSLSSSLYVSSINLSPVKEEAREPPCCSPNGGGQSDEEICVGDIAMTDTVIKVSVPAAEGEKTAAAKSSSSLLHQTEQDICFKDNVT